MIFLVILKTVNFYLIEKFKVKFFLIQDWVRNISSTKYLNLGLYEACFLSRYHFDIPLLRLAFCEYKLCTCIYLQGWNAITLTIDLNHVLLSHFKIAIPIDSPPNVKFKANRTNVYMMTNTINHFIQSIVRF